MHPGRKPDSSAGDETEVVGPGAAPGAESFSGRTLGRYEVLSPLGRGGMGEVYLAHDPRLDRRVAIKLLPVHLSSDPVARERLRREALAAAALDHPFICKVYEIAEQDDALFIVMEYVSGETLRQRLAAGPLPQADALRIAVEIAEALESAHEQHLLHRDLKPANIMLTSQGHVKVMDFGLALRLQAEEAPAGGETITIAAPLTGQGVMVGTLDYMSPEQVRGEPLDVRSDLFSFGVCLAEMLTGRHPFRGVANSDTIAAILRDPPALSAEEGGLPPGLAVFLRRLLAKQPAGRYASFREALDDMRRLNAQPLAGIHEPDETPAGKIILIGRERERDELVRRLGEAMAGRGSVVLIGGEPGIGKTHLARAIAYEAGRRGALAVTGHCYDLEGAPPYVPFIEMLEYGARSTPPAAFRDAVGDSASEIARLMPALRRMYSDIPPAVELPPEQQRRFLFNAYRDFADRAAGMTPIVQIFEDLHWADEATLALFEHTAQTAENTAKLMIATYRDAEVDVSRPFFKTLERLTRLKRATRILLRRLRVDDVGEMLRALGGKPAPPALAAIFFEQTEGNPFFVEEVFRHLTEEQELFDADGEWRSDPRAGSLQVPETIRLVIERRLGRLSGDTRRVLTTAAVLGRTFSLRLLEQMEETHPDAALEAVEQAERVQLVAGEPGREPRYRFVHELVRQTLAETLTLARRQRLHARIAQSVEKVFAADLDPHVSALAHHLFQAGAYADPQTTVTYLKRAAAQASMAAAHSEALAHIDNALTLVGAAEPGSLGELQTARAASLRSLGRFPEAVEAYQCALALFDAAGDNVQFALTSIQLGYIHGWALDVVLARSILRRALDRLGSEYGPLRRSILSLSAGCAGVGGDLDTAMRELDAAEQIGEPEDVRTTGFVYSCEAHTLYHAFRLDLAATAAERAARAFEAAGDLWGQVDAEYVRIFEAVFFGHPERAEPVAEETIRRSERVAHLYSKWACMIGLVHLHTARGDFARAAAQAHEALDLGNSFQCVFGFQNELALANLAFLGGSLTEAKPHFERAMHPAAVSAWDGNAAAVSAWAAALTGAPGAFEALRAVLPRLPQPGHQPGIGACMALVRVVEGFAMLGRRGEAASFQQAAEQVAALGAVCTHDMTRTCAGIAAACGGDWTRAEEHHQAAIEQADALGYRLPLAGAKAWYAEMLLDKGGASGVNQARVLLSEALALYENLGMPLFARRTSDRLAAL